MMTGNYYFGVPNEKMPHSERQRHWKCYGCSKWFPYSVAHGCSPENRNKPSRKELDLQFLTARRNEELKRAWKKDQYGKVKGRFKI